MLAGLGVVVGTIWIGEVVLDAAEVKRDRALRVAAGKAVEEAFRELEPAPERAGGRGAASSARAAPLPPPCDAYHDCCVGYLAALRQVEGAPRETVEATVEACDAIERLRAEDDADDTCRVMLDALRLGVEGWRNTPGFVVPDACR